MPATTSPPPFTPLVPNQTKRPKCQSRQVRSRTQLLRMVQNNFSLSTLLLLGATLQSLLTILIPSIYTLVPILLILLSRLAYSLLVTYNRLPNPYLKDALRKRGSSQVPTKDGIFTNVPASEPVVCFHLGAKYNHPLGMFAPHVKTLGDYFEKMLHSLDTMPQSETGFLGGSNWNSYDANGCNEFVFIAYFRRIEDVHAFAYGPVHRKGWEWWNKLPAEELRHIGINHEIFGAAPGMWEGIYINHQPTLLGGAHYLKKDKEAGEGIAEQWVSGMMDASKGALRTSSGRLGWDPKHASLKNGGYEAVANEYDEV